MVRSVYKLFKISPSKVINDLPRPYLDYLELAKQPKERVHDDPPDYDYLDYKQDYESGYVYREPDQPIPVTMPPNSEKGLWGGLGMVEGFYKKKRMRPRVPRIWFPQIEKHTFYSDILDTYINIEVTERTLELIDKHQGFDFYILKTRPQDLVSEFGRRLQHKLLIALSLDSREFIKEKYADYIRPLEEVGWHGLKENEAITKFQSMRIEEGIAPPLRLTFGQQLVAELKKSKENSARLSLETRDSG